jgi:hypothetical protein
MRHTKRTFRKSSSKSKKFRKTKRSSKRMSKRNKITQKRRHRGGYTWLENWNLQKYADDSEIQKKLASHFNEPMLIGNPAETLLFLKGMNNNYKSIQVLLKEIGIGLQSKEEEAKLMKANTSLKTYQERSSEKQIKSSEEKDRVRRENEQMLEARKKMIEERKREEMMRTRALQREYDERNRDEILRSFKTYGVNNSSRGYSSTNRQ